MSYVLQTSGLATVASSIIAVDSDGVTIRDFVSPTRTANMTVDTHVTTGTSTWKGTSRSYFQTLANGTYGFYGLTFASGYEIPYDCSSGKSAAIFIAHAGASNDPGGLAAIMTESTVSGGIKLTSGNLLTQFFSGGTSATAIPVDGTTKFSFGTSFTYGGASTYYYGLESGALAQDATATDGGFGANRPLSSIGGASGQGNRPAKHHIICVFPRALTLSEHQSLHNDWFGALFQTGGGGGSALRRNSSNLSGLGSPGPFFQNPLQ